MSGRGELKKLKEEKQFLSQEIWTAVGQLSEADREVLAAYQRGTRQPTNEQKAIVRRLAEQLRRGGAK